MASRVVALKGKAFLRFDWLTLCLTATCIHAATGRPRSTNRISQGLWIYLDLLFFGTYLKSHANSIPKLHMFEIKGVRYEVEVIYLECQIFDACLAIYDFILSSTTMKLRRCAMKTNPLNKQCRNCLHLKRVKLVAFEWFRSRTSC